MVASLKQATRVSCSSAAVSASSGLTRTKPVIAGRGLKGERLTVSSASSTRSSSAGSDTMVPRLGQRLSRSSNAVSNSSNSCMASVKSLKGRSPKAAVAASSRPLSLLQSRAARSAPRLPRPRSWALWLRVTMLSAGASAASGCAMAVPMTSSVAMKRPPLQARRLGADRGSFMLSPPTSVLMGSVCTCVTLTWWRAQAGPTYAEVNWRSQFGVRRPVKPARRRRAGCRM